MNRRSIYPIFKHLNLKWVIHNSPFSSLCEEMTSFFSYKTRYIKVIYDNNGFGVTASIKNSKYKPWIVYWLFVNSQFFFNNSHEDMLIKFHDEWINPSIIFKEP